MDRKRSRARAVGGAAFGALLLGLSSTALSADDEITMQVITGDTPDEVYRQIPLPEPASERARARAAFGQSVAERAREGGVDGREIANEARERAAEHREAVLDAVRERRELRDNPGRGPNPPSPPGGGGSIPPGPPGGTPPGQVR